jgi:hypothetical protein
MKRFVLFLFAVIFAVVITPVYAQNRVPELSGTFDSTVNFTAGAGESPNSWGIEEYANLRLRIRPRDSVIFNAAFNVIAMAGNYAVPAVGLGLAVSGQNYAAALELERLYFRINGEYIDTEAGLLRMNFGYSYVWGSMDFLNPRNPLAENARPRGLLGINFSLYPSDSLKLMVFGAAPQNPLESGGGGIIPGLSLNQHWDRASLQALYAYETPWRSDTNPFAGSEWGLHRFGLSLKADIELGFVADVLYTLDPENPGSIKGLSAGGGFDYSFLGGDIYVLFEYLFNGSSSVTALGYGGFLSKHHYLSGTVQFMLNDYSSLALSALFCFDDISFLPSLSLSYELVQGFTLNLSVSVPLDQHILFGGEKGELGPVHPKSPDNTGKRVIVNAGARLRF